LATDHEGTGLRWDAAEDATDDPTCGTYAPRRAGGTVYNVSDLGVCIDRHLTFAVHIDNITREAS